MEISKLPKHVAIIMDGNGRWAKMRNLPRIEGHINGLESAKEIVRTTRELNIPYLTLYAFSKENWQRPKSEIDRLIELMGVYLDRELPSMMENDIRFKAIGEIEDFPEEIQKKLFFVMEKTQHNKTLTLIVALSYSGRREIIRAVKRILEEFRLGKISEIDEETFKKYLYTEDIPDPDLLIRTSGEKRLSNFLLYQMAYTEIYVTDTLWPDFRRKEYLEALMDYSRRERRFGRIKED
ncbi:MAG: isoprenyl transferase [Desulfobacterota bacterium]|nr:isoprenyl transferase [Thermodesulfobacteriota bacterium]MDW8001443.1 isoprenyl transferase [Deltaproteobacteria bacterium]